MFCLEQLWIVDQLPTALKSVFITDERSGKPDRGLVTNSHEVRRQEVGV